MKAQKWVRKELGVNFKMLLYSLYRGGVNKNDLIHCTDEQTNAGSSIIFTKKRQSSLEKYKKVL